MGPIKYVVPVACLVFLVSCSTAPNYGGTIEQITSPMALQYSPYALTKIMVIEISIDFPGVPSKKIISRTICDVTVTREAANLHSAQSCKESSDDGSTSGYQTEATMSSLGKYSNVTYVESPSKPENNNDEAEKMIKNLTESDASVINNPVVSGSSIFKINLLDFLKLPNIDIPISGTVDEVVRGWGTHEGQRVLVTDMRTNVSATIPKWGVIKVNASGYKLLDSKTMAVISEQITSTFEISSNGQAGKMRMAYSSASILK